MKAFRISASILALTMLSVLAACGGGGGGGGGVNPPGGGGGGGPTPTPAPTATPTPGTTPTPVQSATPAPTNSPGGVPVSAYTVPAQIGPQVNGTQGWYTAGVTVSWTPNPGVLGQNGDTTAGANAANSFGTMDGMNCTQTTEPAPNPNTYSVHAFVGIYNNGVYEALPQAIGMKNPTEPRSSGHPNDNYEVETQDCEYNVHTHDYSGLVHLEDQSVSPNSKSTTSPLPYHPTLKTLLDIWGVQLSSSGLTIPGQATLTGPVTVFFGNQGNNLGPHGAPVTDAYQQATATDGSDVGLAWHTTVWIVIGSMPHQPTNDVGLPKVEWRVTY